MTQEEFEKKIKEAKTKGAVNYREQVMLTTPTLDLPNPKERCLLLERVLKASKDDPDFWKGGRRVGIDSDSSLNIASKGSPFLHTVHETDRAEVNGVGGSESLSKKGQWILQMRCHDGTVSVAMTQAYSSGESNLNIISSDVLSKMGFDLVHNATRHIRHLKDQNPFGAGNSSRKSTSAI